MSVARRRSALTCLVISLGCLLVTACGDSSPATGDATSQSTTSSGDAAARPDAPLRIGIATWIGYAPIIVAEKRGLFQKAGLNLTYTVIDDGAQRFAALKAGKLDGVATTVDAYSRINARGIATKQVLAFDHSVGGDGILTKQGVTPATLRGQKIGVPTATTSQFFLARYLEDNGLSLKDIEVVNMTPGDAGTAFLSGRIANAVTYEPYLSKARGKSGSQVLVDSTKYPDLIVDTLGLTPGYIAKHPASVRAFVAAYFEAVKAIETDPDGTYPLLKDYLGQKPGEMAETFKTVKLYTPEENVALMAPGGPIEKLYAESADFWVKIGEISSAPSAADSVDDEFVKSGQS